MNSIKLQSLARRFLLNREISLCMKSKSLTSFPAANFHSLLAGRNDTALRSIGRNNNQIKALTASFSSAAGHSAKESNATYKLISCSEKDGLRIITMNDKKTRNALSLQMMHELISAITTAKSDPNLRCIVLTASTDTPVFSSGHNLKELTSENGEAAQKNIFATCTELMFSIRQAEVPVIAVVRGLAAAAGCQLIAACDFAVVSEKATFSTPGASFGLFCSTPGVAVARAANRVTAAYMVLTGQTLNATEALNCGLVAKVVPEQDLDKSVMQIYSSIQSKSRSVIEHGRKFFYEQIEMPYEKALREGERAMVENLHLKDCQEGLQSFKEKRHPVWSHKTERT